MNNIDKATKIHEIIESKTQVEKFIKTLNNRISENRYIIIEGIEDKVLFKGADLNKFIEYLNRAYGEYILDLEDELNNIL